MSLFHSEFNLRGPATHFCFYRNIANSKTKIGVVVDDKDDMWNFSSKQIMTEKPKVRQEKIISASSKKADLFDFSDFEDPATMQSSALGKGATQTSKATRPLQSMHSFEDSEEEDGLLGSLSRPQANAKAQEQNTIQAATEEYPASSTFKSQSRITSPPPHIIGQIVEMGFSPTQARQALAATDSGLDVSTAIEMLLEEAKRSQPSQEESRESDRRMAIRMQEEENNKRPSPREVMPRKARTDETRVSNGTFEVAPDWQKQADQIYSQASEIGASLFSRANTLWSTAKAQAQRALDERATESGQSSGRSSPAGGSERAKNRRWAVAPRDGGASQRNKWQGKPKWMIDAENEEQEQGGMEAGKTKEVVPSKGDFRDDDDDDNGGGDLSAPPVKAFSERPATAAAAVAEKEANLAPPTNFWRGEGESSIIPTEAAHTSRKSSPLASQPGSSRQSPIPRKAPSVQNTVKAESKTHRQVTQDDSSAIQSSFKHKQRGNELFKKGAYGEAEVAYGNALNFLEETSLRRVALLNNRASARLKNGDARSALVDTKEVLTLIVMGESKKGSPFLLFRPSREHALPLPEYADINLREGYAKALLRRAQAEEMLEQWETAQSVWSLLEKYEKEEGSGKGGMINLRAAQDGSKRCFKMLGGGDVELSAPATRRVHAAAIQAVAKAERLAKERIRSENAIAAAEEAEKDNLRDTVDGRILAWKNGKEANVRALLASLHDVVWPGLGWKKVGMHELVMDNQVKRCYMRAIGKLHPDKVNNKDDLPLFFLC